MAEQEAETPRFSKPEKANEPLVAELRSKFGIPEEASLEDIEPIATPLLSKPQTFIIGAELVLNRWIGAEESEIIQLKFAGSGEEIFALLLLQKAIEIQRREQE